MSQHDESTVPPPPHAAHKKRPAPTPMSVSSLTRLQDVSENQGALLGLETMIHHTLLACSKRTPHLQTTGRGDWKAVPVTSKRERSRLAGLGFEHDYVRRCLLYDGSNNTKNKNGDDQTTMPPAYSSDWKDSKSSILGCISIYYASQDALEEDELVLSCQEENDHDSDDLPATLLYRAVVEYKTLRPSSGNAKARQAEELSMLTFGASVDDDIKFGALSSVYDELGKYTLEIQSVRGKTYTFDVMDATLSDGTVPRCGKPKKAASAAGAAAGAAAAPKKNGKADKDSGKESNPDSKQEEQDEGDPFGKSLCVTVADTEPDLLSWKSGDDASTTKLTLRLQGNLRPDALESLSSFHYIPRKLQNTFPLIGNPQQVMAYRRSHALLLEKQQAGRVYVNGRHMVTWGADARLSTNAHALFGVEFRHSVPVWHGRIVNFHVLKVEYAALWQELLIDARHAQLNLASKLLSRLLHGRDPEDMEYDDDDDDSGRPVEEDCLESQVMSSKEYDPVGICAKALATRFSMEFGKSAFPCLSHEVDWVRTMLGHMKPVVVSQRALSVLRRGGYFDVQRTMQELLFLPKSVTKLDREEKVVQEATVKLMESGCTDIMPHQVLLVELKDQPGAVEQKLMCRFDASLRQYHVNRQVMDMEKPAFTLGMYLAQEHPDGSVLLKYMLHHCGK